MIGEITNYKNDKTKLIISTYCGDGLVKIKDKTFNIQLRTSIMNYPIIVFGDKQFVLNWSDIIDLAKDAGLFNEDPKEEK